jgi:hypothetical protein
VVGKCTGVYAGYTDELCFQCMGWRGLHEW